MATAETRVWGKRQIAITIGAIAMLLVVFVALLKVFDVTVSFRAAPPVEELAFERTVFTEGGIELHVRNDGADAVDVAQLLINDAYWNFEITDSHLSRLETATITTTYPWEDGLPVNLQIVTSTGVTIGHEVPAASLTPVADRSTFLTYALLGLYIGVIPVALGLFAFPALKRLPRAGLGFFLALTIGLLVFLLVDTTIEGLELAGATAASLDGIALFAIGGLLAVSVLLWFEGWLDRRRAAASGSTSRGMTLAFLIAAGIGLHNLGEGLAVGSALAAGEVGLGTFLILGFALHNTTEGLAIVSPLGSEKSRPSLRNFALLGAIAGVPTIFGAWIGGFAFSPAWATLMFGIAAGAIAQVIWAIGSSMRGEAAMTRGWPTLGFLAGLLIMYATGLAVP